MSKLTSFWSHVKAPHKFPRIGTEELSCKRRIDFQSSIKKVQLLATTNPFDYNESQTTKLQWKFNDNWEGVVSSISECGAVNSLTYCAHLSMERKENGKHMTRPYCELCMSSVYLWKFSFFNDMPYTTFPTISAKSMPSFQNKSHISLHRLPKHCIRTQNEIIMSNNNNCFHSAR